MNYGDNDQSALIRNSITHRSNDMNNNVNDNNGFLNDTDGGRSSMRLVMVIVSLVIIGIWAVVSFRNNAMSDIPSGVLYLMIATLFGKVVQKGIELGNFGFFGSSQPAQTTDKTDGEQK